MPETTTLPEEGFVFAVLLDGNGGGRELTPQELKDWRPEDGCVWVHLARDWSGTETWLKDTAGLDELVTDALLANETRPRAVAVGDGLLVLLRGVNLNPGAEPDDMVSLRIWADAQQVISLRSRRVMAAQDVRKLLALRQGPRSSGELLTEMADRLMDRIEPVIDSLSDQIESTDAEQVEGRVAELRARLALLRRQAIALRRYLAPQRDVLSRLTVERPPWLTDGDRARLREILDRLMRFVEDLDAAREQALVTRDELSSRLSEQMNRTMYMLSLVATIFLPLGLLTGLLGINVGGIPGTDNPLAFAVVCLLLVGLGVLEAALLRRKRL